MWWQRLWHRHGFDCEHRIEPMGIGSAMECLDCGVDYGVTKWCVGNCAVAMEEWRRNATKNV